MKRIITIQLLIIFNFHPLIAQTGSLEIDGSGDVVISSNLTVESDLTVASNLIIEGEMPLAPGFIYGLETSIGEDSEHDIAIAPGICRSYSDDFIFSNDFNLILSGQIEKRIDAPWAEGNGEGGRFSDVSLEANSTYHLFLIRKENQDGTITIDAGWDDDLDPTLPSGYIAYRRIASCKTDIDANIIPYKQFRNKFVLDPMINIYHAISVILPATRTNIITPIPGGILAEGIINIGIRDGSDQKILLYETSELIPYDFSPTYELSHINLQDANHASSLERYIIVDSNSLISFRSDSTYRIDRISISAIGWIDDRGQHGGK